MTFTHGSLISIYIIQIVYNVFNIHQVCKWLMPAIVIWEMFRKDKYSNDGIFLLRSAEWAAGISFCVFSSGGNGIGLRGFTIMGRGNWMYLGKTLWEEMAPMDSWLVSFIYAWYSHDYVCNIETMELFNTGGISKGCVYAACMCVCGMWICVHQEPRPPMGFCGIWSMCFCGFVCCCYMSAWYHHVTSNSLMWSSQIARFVGPTWGPSGADMKQADPILAPWTLLSGFTSTEMRLKWPAVSQTLMIWYWDSKRSNGYRAIRQICIGFGYRPHLARMIYYREF